MYKLIIFFVALTISVASSAKLNNDVVFDIELKKLSEFLDQDFKDLNDVKSYLEHSMVQLKNEEDPTGIAQKVLVEVERLYQILEEAKGPRDLIQLKKFGEELEDVVGKAFLKIVENIEANMPAIEEMIKKILEDFMGLISKGLKDVFVKPSKENEVNRL